MTGRAAGVGGVLGVSVDTGGVPPAWPVELYDASAGPARRLLLCDRDGVIIANRSDHVRSVADLELLAGSAAALRRAQDGGFALAIVSNQSVVGRGFISVDDAVGIQRALLDRLADHGVRIAASYLCPHAPWHGCGCRKPGPGMLLRAVERLGVPPDRCFMVGDAHEDMRAARQAGVPGLFVRTGRGAEHQHRVLEDAAARPVAVVADLAAAVEAALDAAARDEAAAREEAE